MSTLSSSNPLLSTPKKLDKWHKEPWMLLVIGGPLLVVIAAISTGIIAWKSQDKVISGDYYRQGLHIDQDLARDAKARLYDMQAQLSLVEGQKLQLQLKGASALPPVANLTIASGDTGLQASEAQYKVIMHQVHPGLYAAPLPAALLIDKTHWYLKLSGEDWRLTARWQHGAQTVSLRPQRN
jgi:hypothetical protein